MRSLLVGLLLTGCVGPDGLFLARVEPEAPPPPPPSRGPAPSRSLSATRPAAVAAAVDVKPSKPAHTWRSATGPLVEVPPEVFLESSLEGRELCYWSVGQGEEVVLILGAIHGNERSSSLLAFRFLQDLQTHPELLQNRRVIVAPLVNPDGYENNRRSNVRSVDLNRNFPAENWKHVQRRSSRPHGLYPGSEPEARFVIDLIERFEPVCVVSIHGAARCVNWDGPAEQLARTMSRQCGLPARASIGYPTPGSLGSWVGLDRDTPIITLELAANDAVRLPYEGYRQALLTAVHH